MKQAKVDVKTPIKHDWCMSNYDFFERIRKSGGWEKGSNCKYIAFYHSIESDNRECAYFTYPIRTGWWTAICSKEDYLKHIEEWYKNNLKNQRVNNNVSCN